MTYLFLLAGLAVALTGFGRWREGDRVGGGGGGDVFGARVLLRHGRPAAVLADGGGAIGRRAGRTALGRERHFSLSAWGLRNSPHDIDAGGANLVATQEPACGLGSLGRAGLGRGHPDALHHAGARHLSNGVFLHAGHPAVARDPGVGGPARARVALARGVALLMGRQPLEPVSQFARDGSAFDARDLLEVSELRHFHSVAPAFPAQPPGAERRAFPIVLDEADVVQMRIDADGGERLQVQLLQVRRRRLDDHLELVIVLQPVGIFTVAAVLRPARGLHIGGLPRFRPERAQRGRRMKRARSHFHVVGLQDHAALVRPEPLQGENETLERAFRAHVRR